MPRQVIEGTPGNLTVVRPNDLPQKANHSFLRYCDIRGRWANRSLGYVDIVDCKVSADFSRANIGYIESFNSDWEGAKLTDNQLVANICTFDIRQGRMASAWRAHTGLTSAQIDTLLSIERDIATDSLSPRQLARKVAAALGMTVAEFRPHVINVYSPKAHLFRGEGQHVDGGSVVGAKPFLSVVYPSGRTSIPIAEWPPALRDLVRTHDRWRLARACEQWMDTYSPESAPWICLWERLWPTPNNTCEPEGQLSAIGLATMKLGQNA